jgi:hypothetical protein
MRQIGKPTDPFEISGRKISIALLGYYNFEGKAGAKSLCPDHLSHSQGLKSFQSALSVLAMIHRTLPEIFRAEKSLGNLQKWTRLWRPECALSLFRPNGIRVSQLHENSPEKIKNHLQNSVESDIDGRTFIQSISDGGSPTAIRPNTVH